MCHYFCETTLKSRHFSSLFRCVTFFAFNELSDDNYSTCQMQKLFVFALPTCCCLISDRKWRRALWRAHKYRHWIPAHRKRRRWQENLNKTPIARNKKCNWVTNGRTCSDCVPFVTATCGGLRCRIRAGPASLMPGRHGSGIGPWSLVRDEIQPSRAVLMDVWLSLQTAPPCYPPAMLTPNRACWNPAGFLSL